VIGQKKAAFRLVAFFDQSQTYFTYNKTKSDNVRLKSGNSAIFVKNSPSGLKCLVVPVVWAPLIIMQPFVVSSDILSYGRKLNGFGLATSPARGGCKQCEG